MQNHVWMWEISPSIWSLNKIPLSDPSLSKGEFSLEARGNKFVIFLDFTQFLRKSSGDFSWYIRKFPFWAWDLNGTGGKQIFSDLLTIYPFFPTTTRKSRTTATHLARHCVLYVSNLVYLIYARRELELARKFRVDLPVVPWTLINMCPVPVFSLDFPYTFIRGI